MARTTKYDWPDDQKLQALLDEHGTVETARHVGCPPSSLRRRIRKRGLRGSHERRTPGGANGNGSPIAANANGNPGARNGNGGPDPANENGKPEAARASEKPDADAGHEKRQAAERGNSEGSPPAKAKTPDAKPQGQIHEPKPAVLQPRLHFGYARDEGFGDPPAAERPQEKRAAMVETGADSSVAEGTSRADPVLALMRRVPPPMQRVPSLMRRVPPPIWRLVAVLGLAAVAALAAFISVGNDPKTFQRESSFAVRPSSDVPPASVNDVLGTLAQPDSAITETIVNMLGSPRLRNFAARSAGVSPSSVGGSGAEYEWSATRRTGSTIIDVRLTGPNEDKLLAMQTAAAPEAARLVEESYSPYRLETLSAPSPAVQVGPKVARTVGLALLLGALLGITLVLVERRLRSSLPQRDGPARAHAERGESWGH
jgi:hypothetical protein